MERSSITVRKMPAKNKYELRGDIVYESGTWNQVCIVWEKRWKIRMQNNRGSNFDRVVEEYLRESNST